MLLKSGIYFYFRFLDRLVSTLEEKKLHEVKLKEGLKDIATKRMELQNSLSSSWPKQVMYNTFDILSNVLRIILSLYYIPMIY